MPALSGNSVNELHSWRSTVWGENFGIANQPSCCRLNRIEKNLPPVFARISCVGIRTSFLHSVG